MKFVAPRPGVVQAQSKPFSYWATTEEMASSKPARMITGGKVGRQPSNGTNLAAAVIASATAPATATQGGKSGKNDLSDAEDASPDLSAEELLEQCKCPISLELMRRPVLP